MKSRLLRLTGSAVALWLAFAVGPARSADQPPQHLHLVGDHWTAWNPPTEFPPGTEVYTIVRGDTLWDLAARFHNNPYLWPQIWERNQYILDAHWIYPGDPLVVGAQVVPPTDIAGTGEPGPGEPGGPPAEPLPALPGVITALEAAGPPAPLGSEQDIYCSGYIGEVDEEFGYHLIGSEYEMLAPHLKGVFNAGARADFGTVDSVKYGLSSGDIVYIDGGRAAGLVPGALFSAVGPGEKVEHPLTDDTIGRYYRHLGRVRILSVQDESAIAEVVFSCMPMLVGSPLKAFEPEPVPLGRRTATRPANDPVSADVLTEAPAIVLSENRIISLGADNVVHIDRGMDDDVTPGDIFTIYRLNHEGMPPIVVGELAVLSVHAHSSLAKILQSRHTVFVGDRLDRK